MQREESNESQNKGAVGTARMLTQVGHVAQRARHSFFEGFSRTTTKITTNFETQSPVLVDECKGI